MNGRFRWLYLLALALIVLAVVTIAILTLLGPTTGVVMPGVNDALK